MENNLVINGELVAGIVAGAYADPEPLKSGNRTITKDPGFDDIKKGEFHISKNEFEQQFPDISWIDFEKIGSNSDIKN